MMIDIDALRKLEQVATPGPWQVFTIASPTGISQRLIYEQDPLSDDDSHAIDLAHIPMPWPKNGDFIVAMRNALPDLFALLEEARELADATVLYYREGAPRRLGTLDKARAFLSKFETKREA